MRAAVYRTYGPPAVVRIEERPKPVPKANEVLIRIYAASVTSADARIRSLNVPKGFGAIMRLVFGVLRPRKGVLGTELAGIVERAGDQVTQFKAGDAVFAFPGVQLGSHAEYRTMPADGRILPKPPNLSFEEAAALSFAGSAALYFLRDRGKIQRGDSVLIIGASGAVGSAAVQLAKHDGATVTGVSSTANLDLVRSLGADHLIDYTKQDFTRTGERYDIIFDSVGATSFDRCKDSLKPGGRLLLTVAGLADMVRTGSKPEGKSVIAGNAQERLEDMMVLKQLAEADQFRPVIDRTYPLEDIAKAHARVDTGRKTGSVVVTFGDPARSSPAQD